MTQKVTIETKNLTGTALDWAVGMVAGASDMNVSEHGSISCKYRLDTYCDAWAPSSEWEVGGPLIKEMRVAIEPEYEGEWHAKCYGDEEAPESEAEGRTPLIAAMRAIVASIAGATVEVPKAAA